MKIFNPTVVFVNPEIKMIFQKKPATISRAPLTDAEFEAIATDDGDNEFEGVDIDVEFPSDNEDTLQQNKYEGKSSPKSEGIVCNFILIQFIHFPHYMFSQILEEEVDAFLNLNIGNKIYHGKLLFAACNCFPKLF